MFILFLFLFQPAQAADLTLEQVVKSSLKHYPQVIEGLAQVKAAEGQLESTEGVFDAKIKGETNARDDGFYIGDVYKGALHKPFPFLNGEVYSGFRKSVGNFPSYEGKMVTLPRGEGFFGISISLLRNSLIDIRRYQVRLSEQDAEQARQKLNQIKIDVQTLAIQAYWYWVVSGYEVRVYQELLDLAQTRVKGIRGRIRRGDLAKIYQVENQQYIVKRRSQLQKTQIRFREAQIYLSLFYRDPQGQPRKALPSQLPKIIRQGFARVNQPTVLYQQALKKNLELKILESQDNQAQVTRRLGTNEMLPKIDVDYEWSQDYGDQNVDITRQDQETRIMLNVEIPIQYRKGRGKRTEGEQKSRAIQYKQKLTREKLKVHIDNLAQKINTVADVIDLTYQQIDMAAQLAKAEMRKFRSGASDLILVNLREENLAEAQIENLESVLKYQQDQAQLKQALVEFVK